jgi:integrase
MPVTVSNLQTPTARLKLKERHKPYFLELGRGLAIGYRRGERGKRPGKHGGSWLLREFKPDGQGGGQYVQRRLGLADDVVDADHATVLTWADAQRAATGDERPTLTVGGRFTVAQAAEEYFEDASKKRDVASDRSKYTVAIETTLGARPIADLSTSELKKWLTDQVAATDDRELRRRQQATANRHWTVLRAILNLSFEHERAPSADAWKRVRPFKNVDRARERHLSVDEAQALLGALRPPLRELANGSLLTGLRLGELQALRAGDVKGGAVQIRHSKSGKARHVPLTAEGVAFFAQLTKGKPGDALVFPTPVHNVTRQMTKACTAAKIERATFHDCRRSYGSLLINSGAPASTIQRLLGHADMRMTIRNYAHLLDETLQSAVDEHLPNFTAQNKITKPRKNKRRDA